LSLLLACGPGSGSAPAAAVTSPAEGGAGATVQGLTTAPTVQAGGLQTGGSAFKYRAAPNVVSATRIGITTVDNRKYIMGAAFRISTAAPSVACRLLARNDYDIRITTSRTLEVRVGGVLIGSASAALTLGQTYYIELAITANSAGNDYVEGWLNGVSFASSSGTNLSTLLGNNFDFGANTTAYGATVVIEWSDFYVVDDQGSAPCNDRLNQPKIPSSFPTSDVSRDAGWEDSDDTTTNLYQSVDNTPPVGIAPVAGAGAADKMVKNAISTTTENVVFDLQSANTVGIDADDTILATQLVTSHGLDSATSTTSCTHQIVAGNGHPGTSEASFDPNLASGTWPTNWLVGRTITENPTITDRSVSPRVEIGKRTATTRVVAVCQVRIDWIFLPVVGGTTNSETGAVVGGSAVAAARITDRPRANTLQAGSLLAGADVGERAELTSVLGKSVLSGADVSEHPELASLLGKSVLAGVGTRDRLKSGSVLGQSVLAGDSVFNANALGSVLAGSLLAGTSSKVAGSHGGSILGQSVLSGADAITYSELGSLLDKALLAGADSYSPAETGAILGRALLAGTDAEVRAEAGAILAMALLAGGDAYTSAELGSIIGRSVLSGIQVEEAPGKAGFLLNKALVSGADSIQRTKAGSILSGSVLSGFDQEDIRKFGALLAGSTLHGVDAETRSKMGAVVAGALLSGADALIAVEAGSVLAKSILGADSASGSGKSGSILATSLLKGKPGGTLFVVVFDTSPAGRIGIEGHGSIERPETGKVERPKSGGMEEE